MSFDVICFPQNEVINREFVSKVLNDSKREENIPILVPFIEDAPIVASALLSKRIFVFINDEGLMAFNNKRENTICEITYDKAIDFCFSKDVSIGSEFIKNCKELNIEIFIGNDRKFKGTTIKNSISHN